MESILLPSPAPPDQLKPARRRPRFDGTNFVIALYTALVLGTPAIIRFVPDADARWIAAINAPPPVQCAGAADIPSGCAANAAAASLPIAGGCRRRDFQTSTRSMPPALALAT